MGCNLNEVEEFAETIKKLRKKIESNESYKDELLNQGGEYHKIKEYFRNFCSFIRYQFDIDCKNFYRIRKTENNVPYTLKKDLIYPEPSLSQEDRMSNTSFRVLYTSFHRFTAMAESRIDKSFIGKTFQLTRFSTDKPLTVFKLGLFSELSLNSPTNSNDVKDQLKIMFGAAGHAETALGYSALECSIADVLYSQENGYHILSSIMADAIFSSNPKIDAILYPSVQNRYGMNLAIKKECADTLQIKYSSLNRLTSAYSNGFYHYYTEMECADFPINDKYKFKKTEDNYISW